MNFSCLDLDIVLRKFFKMQQYLFKMLSGFEYVCLIARLRLYKVLFFRLGESLFLTSAMRVFSDTWRRVTLQIRGKYPAGIRNALWLNFLTHGRGRAESVNGSKVDLGVCLISLISRAWVLFANVAVLRSFSRVGVVRVAFWGRGFWGMVCF